MWPAANTHDIATLYRLAIEKGPAGQIYHGVEGPSYPRKLIAETIAESLGIEAKSITNDITRSVLGWEPSHPNWVQDVRSGHYVRATAAA